MLGRRIRWGWKWTKSALLDGEITDESQERASEQGASGATSWRKGRENLHRKASENGGTARKPLRSKRSEQDGHG